MQPHSVLVTVTGFDRPGVTSALFAALAAHDVEVLDVQQVVIRDRLVLGVVLALHGDPGPLRRAATHAAEALGAEVEVTVTEDGDNGTPRRLRHHVIVLGRPLRAGAVGEVARRIADLGANIDSITRLSHHPVTSLELIVSGADHIRLAAALVAAAKATGTDIALERASWQRLAKRLVLVDVDHALVLGGDTLALLAQAAGRGAEYARMLDSVPAADWPRADLLRQRVALLSGIPASMLDDVRSRFRWPPETQTLVATLKRLGYRRGIVSGAASQVIEPLVEPLGLDYVASNRLEIVGGQLTGRLVGDPIDRAGKARALVQFAEAYGVSLSQTVAVGGGDADVDLVTLAGLGVAVNLGPAVWDAPDVDPEERAAYLDALLFVIGMSADQGDEPDLSGSVATLRGSQRTVR